MRERLRAPAREDTRDDVAQGQPIGDGGIRGFAGDLGDSQRDLVDEAPRPVPREAESTGSAGGRWQPSGAGMPASGLRAAREVNKILALLGRILDDAVERGYLRDNPGRRVRRLCHRNATAPDPPAP